MDNQELNLAPCPFCGGKAEPDALMIGEAGKDNATPHGHFIECQTCLALSGSHDTPEAAAEAWNQRTQHSPSSGSLSVFAKGPDPKSSPQGVQGGRECWVTHYPTDDGDPWGSAFGSLEEAEKHRLDLAGGQVFHMVEAPVSPSLEAPKASEVEALDLVKVKGYRDIAEDLLRKAIGIANEPSPKWYKDSDAKIAAIKALADVWDQECDRMRTRLRSLPLSAAPVEEKGQAGAVMAALGKARRAYDSWGGDEMDSEFDRLMEYLREAFAAMGPSAPSVLRGPSALAPEILMCVGCGWDARDPIRDAEHPNALACCPDHDFRPLPAAARYARDLVPDARDMVNGWIIDLLKEEPSSGSPERAEGPR